MAQYKYVSELRRQGREEGALQGRMEGYAQGMTRSVLKVLRRRGLEAPPEVRDRVLACTDPAAAERLLFKALSVRSAEEVVDEGELVEARIHGMSHSVVLALEGRGIEVPEAVRRKVSACAEYDVLRGWLRRIGTVQAAEELLEDLPNGNSLGE